MTDDEDDDDERTAPILQVVDFNALNAALGDAPSSPPPPAPSRPPETSDSAGRTSATYSAAPRALPQTRAPVMDPHTPAVIIQTDDTAPTGPPIQMTVPMAGAPPPGSRGGPHAASAVSNSELSATIARKKVARPRQPTMIVRPRGPTAMQKFIVFMAMLIVFVAGGVAFLVYGGAFSALGVEIPALRRP